MNTAPTLQAADLLAAAEACMAAADAGDVQAERRAVCAVIEHQATIRMGLINARHQRLSQTPHATERLPLRVPNATEDGCATTGEDYGHIAARIPKEEFWHFVQQRNFGYEGFMEEGGLRDFLKTRPGCRVKTVTGKTSIAVPRRVHFARGTLNLAT